MKDFCAGEKAAIPKLPHMRKGQPADRVFLKGVHPPVQGGPDSGLFTQASSLCHACLAPALRSKLRRYKMAGDRYAEPRRKRHGRRGGKPSAQTLARIGVRLYAHRVPVRVTNRSSEGVYPVKEEREGDHRATSSLGEVKRIAKSVFQVVSQVF
jgi:hypothetical protein